MMTLVHALPRTGLSPSSPGANELKQTLADKGVSGQRGYTEPGVIMDPFAIDFPDPITTTFYVMPDAQTLAKEIDGKEVAFFPKQYSLEDIINGFKQILIGAGIQAQTNPKDIDSKTSFVKFRYGEKYEAAMLTNEAITILNASFEMLSRQYDGVRGTYSSATS